MQVHQKLGRSDSEDPGRAVGPAEGEGGPGEAEPDSAAHCCSERTASLVAIWLFETRSGKFNIISKFLMGALGWLPRS